MINWPTLISDEIQSLNDVTLALHLASQFLGAAGSCLISPEPDYSHTSMTWNSERNWFIGKELPSKQVIHLALDADGMVLLLIDEHHQILSSFELTSETIEDGIIWVKAVLGFFAIYTSDYKIDMQDDIPDHPVRHGEPFPLFSPEDYQTFIKVRNIGNKVMLHYADQYEHASPVETWPHHFDIGTYIPLVKKEGETTHSISLGMAVKDAYVDEHYFYVTHWAKDGDIDYENLPDLPSGGFWNRKDFTGAFLRLSDVIKNHQTAKGQWSAIQSFMDTGIQASITLLGI